MNRFALISIMAALSGSAPSYAASDQQAVAEAPRVAADSKEGQLIIKKIRKLNKQIDAQDVLHQRSGLGAAPSIDARANPKTPEALCRIWLYRDRQKLLDKLDAPATLLVELSTPPFKAGC